MAKYIEQGIFFLEKKEFSKAIEYFQAAIEENPKNEHAHFLLGKTYCQANKLELAQRTFFSLLSINPCHTEALAEIQKLSFSSYIPERKSSQTDIKAKDADPIIRIVPPDENETVFWMTEQLSGNKLYYIVGEDGCIVVCPQFESWAGFDEPTGLLVIPNGITINGAYKKVLMINDCAFYGNKKITGVILPDSLLRIQQLAFTDTQIRKITLPTQLQHIGEGAFANTQLTDIVFPPHLRTIDDYAFWNTKIRHIVLPDSVQEVGHYCFMGCILEKIHLNEGIISIGHDAFCDTIVPEVDIPKSVEYLGSTIGNTISQTIIKLHGSPPVIITYDTDKRDDRVIENIDEDVILDEFMVSRDYFHLYRTDSVWQNINVKPFNN